MDCSKQVNYTMKAAFEGSSQPNNPAPKKKTTKVAKKKAAEVAPTLAGGVSVGDALSPRRSRNGTVRQAPSSTPSSAVLQSLVSTTPSNDIEVKQDVPFQALKTVDNNQATPETPAKPISILKKSTRGNFAGKLDPASPLASTSIISTASTKLSYLMDRILLHHDLEKILVFYEADNVAYYIAQALECLGIKHLIYAKTLSSARRAQYVVTFNQSQVLSCPPHGRLSSSFWSGHVFRIKGILRQPRFLSPKSKPKPSSERIESARRNPSMSRLSS